MLTLKRWSFGEKDAHMPHRHYIIATATLKDSRYQVQVSCNHGAFKATWFLTASGPGFAGAKSKAINTRRTQSEKVAKGWIEAVESGQVEII